MFLADPVPPGSTRAIDLLPPRWPGMLLGSRTPWLARAGFLAPLAFSPTCRRGLTGGGVVERGELLPRPQLASVGATGPDRQAQKYQGIVKVLALDECGPTPSRAMDVDHPPVGH